MVLDPTNTFLTKPTCPACGTTIHWGITTTINNKTKKEVCNVCKTVLSKE